MKPSSSKSESQTIATHRKALRDYELLERWETGLQLVGTEVKSIRNRQVSLEDSFARIDGGEVFLYNMHVTPYAQGGRFNVEPKRVRKLLLHRQQIERLTGLLSKRGVTLVPIRLYFKHGLAKVELALGKGKKLYEKRAAIREREMERELRQLVRSRQKRGGD